MDESSDTIRKRVAIAEAGVIQGTASVNSTYENMTKPSDCTHCSEHLESRGALKKHIRKVHPEKNGRPVSQPSEGSLMAEQPVQQAGGGSTPAPSLQSSAETPQPAATEAKSPHVKDPTKEKPEYETPPEHLQAVHDLREWMERELPNAAKRICVKPCGFGYGDRMGLGL